MDQASVFIQYSKNRGQLVDYMYISAVSLLVYDYALTLHLEIKYVWFSRWSYTKVLFLLTRYMAFVIMFILLQNQVFLNVSLKVCKATWPAASWLMVLKHIFAEIILCVRTWAVWNRDKTVGVMFATMMLAYLAVGCSLMNKAMPTFLYVSPPYSGFRGCFLVGANRLTSSEQFILLFVVQFIVLILMVISAFRLYRTARSSELSFIIHRDGIMFYVYMLFFSGANLVAIFAGPIGIMDLFTPLEVVLHTVFTSRIILNIRSAANRGLNTELHTNCLENLESISSARSIEFVSLENAPGL